MGDIFEILQWKNCLVIYSSIPKNNNLLEVYATLQFRGLFWKRVFITHLHKHVMCQIGKKRKTGKYGNNTL